MICTGDEEAGQYHCKDSFGFLWVIVKMKFPEDQEKNFHFQARQTKGSEKLQTSQPCTNPWESEGTKKKKFPNMKK